MSATSQRTGRMTTVGTGAWRLGRPGQITTQACGAEWGACDHTYLELRLQLIDRILVGRRADLQQQIAFLHRLVRLGIRCLDLSLHIGNERTTYWVVTSCAISGADRSIPPPRSR